VAAVSKLACGLWSFLAGLTLPVSQRDGAFLMIFDFGEHLRGAALYGRLSVRNLAALAREVHTAGSGPVAGRGATVRDCHGGQVAVKRQPGTAMAGKTGTVPPQGGTTNRALARAR
jgi:hypothetical protein